jgi:hypothetical protein
MEYPFGVTEDTFSQGPPPGQELQAKEPEPYAPINAPVAPFTAFCFWVSPGELDELQ